MDTFNRIVHDVLLGMYNLNNLYSSTDRSKAWAAGKLTDQYGPRIPIAIGSFLHIFGLMMTSISTKYYQIFLSQSVVSAFGCSFLFFPCK